MNEAEYLMKNYGDRGILHMIRKPKSIIVSLFIHSGTRHGNVYLSVREEQGIVTRNCCLSVTCFTISDISACCFTSISRARHPENQKY